MTAGEQVAEKARNEFGERIYTLADFADDGVDVEHPLTARRLPVLSHCYPSFKFHTALVIGGPDWDDESNHGQEPEPFEVEQLLADLEYRLAYYNDAYRARVERRGPFMARQLEARHERRDRLIADPSLATHGTTSTYKNWMCRCVDCRAAYAASRKPALAAVVLLVGCFVQAAAP